MKTITLLLVVLSIKIFSYGQDTVAFSKKISNKGNITQNKNSETTYLQGNYNSIILKISPLQILGGDFITNSLSVGLSMEKTIKRPYSVYVGVRYVFTDKRDVIDKRWIVINVKQVNGFNVDAELRRYFSKDNSEMSGAYLSANLKSIYTQAKYQGYIVNRFSSSSYINIGWQEIFDSGFVFDIAVGIGFKYVISNSNTNLNDHTYHIMDGGKKPYHTGSAFFPFINLNINLGYNFNNK